MASEIKTRLTLEGEKEYKAQLDAAYSSLRVLRSELKAQTAEMGRNASAQDKARAKADSLRKQITQQEKIVSALTSALEQAKTQYADNEEVQNKWQEKLANARTVLANMKNQLESCSDGVDKFTNSVKDVDGDTDAAVHGVVDLGGALESLQNIAKSVADLVGSAFNGIVENAKNAASMAWTLMTDAMTAANDWQGIVDIYGGDVATVERYSRIVSSLGGSMSTLTGAMDKVIQKTHAGDAGIAEGLSMLQGLGFAVGDESQYSNHLDYFLAIWDALAAINDEAERWEIAAKFFGDKSTSGVSGLLADWSKGDAAFEKNIKDTGLVISGEDIEKLNDAKIALGLLQETWQALLDKTGAEIFFRINMPEGIELAQKLLNDIAMLSTGTGDSDEITKDIVLNVQALFDWATTGIASLSQWFSELSDSFENSDDPTMQNIGSLLKSIADLLQWFSDNSDTITAALKAWVDFKIADIEAQLKWGVSLTDIASTLGSIGMEIGKIVGIMKLTDAGKSWVKDAATAGGAETVAGASLFSRIGQWTANVAGPAITGFMANAASMLTQIDPTGMFGTVIYDKLIRPIKEGTFVENVSNAASDMSKNASDWMTTYSNTRRYISDRIDAFIADAIGFATDAGGGVADFFGMGKNAEYVPAFTAKELWDEYIASGKQQIYDYDPTTDTGRIVSAGSPEFEAAFIRLLDRMQTQAGNRAAEGQRALIDSINGATVIMDGETVGRLVAPTVDRYIGYVMQ